MGKREEEKRPRREKDYYGTIDPDAIVPKFISLVYGKTYAEPCYGNGCLEDLLMEVATCKWRSDIRETVACSKQMDALDITKSDLQGIDMIITNPPYDWGMLKPLLDYLPTLKPTWFLLPADHMHNKRMAHYMRKCAHVVSVGRLYWMENRVKGVDNYVWYRFHEKWDIPTQFHPRD